MAVINTGLLASGLRSEFFARLEAVKALYPMLSMRVPSTKDSESFRWLGSLGQMREFGTGRVARGLRAEKYDVASKKYEFTLEVDRDELSDDQTGQIAIRVAEMAQWAATHKDYLIGLLLANGAAADALCYDGLPFFSAAHVSGSSGSQTNSLTYDVTTPSNATTAEMKEAIKQAVATMLAYKNDQGQPANLAMSGLKVLVPPNLYFAAAEALNARLIGNTDNMLAGVAEPVSFPFLTATDTFYLLKVDGAQKPFIFQDREPIEFTSLAENSSEEFLREKYYYGVRARYAMAYGPWSLAVKTQLV
ncbi:MAG: Mu-like prophage major head subunit gpT family protein [Phycisphaerae bacterium]